MKISFLVTVHNETTELQTLLSQLNSYLDSTGHKDEVVILDDYSTNKDTIDLIDTYSSIDNFTVVKHKLDVKGEGFGGHKQFGNEQCSGDYIFQVDADEYFSDALLYNLKELLIGNPTVDLFLIPRVNIIRELNVWNYAKYGWQISKLDEFEEQKVFDDQSSEYQFIKNFNFVSNEKRISETQIDVTYKLPIINWGSGDYQYRLYRNSKGITWDRPLHELIIGADVQTYLPKEVEWSLIHDKTMRRQTQQNTFYMTEFSQEMNTRN